MQIHQSIDRQIPGFRLTLVLTPTKLIIRAFQNNSSNLFLCQFIKGQLRQDIKLIYQNQDGLFDQLISPATNLTIEDDQLKLPYTIINSNRPKQKEFLLPLIKVQANQFQVLKNKVAQFDEQVKKFTLLEQQMKSYKNIIANLQKRSQIFHYREGQLRSLILDELNNPEYQIRLNYLRKKDVKKQRNSHSQVRYISSSLVSAQPIDFSCKIFSYKIKVCDVVVQKQKNAVFIGLCYKLSQQINTNPFFGQTEEKFKFITPQGILSYPQQSKELIHHRLQTKGEKETLCDLFYKQKITNYPASKGDVYVLTVDVENGYLTWYKNEVSLERIYFQRPTSNVYPFVWMTPNTEISF